MPAGPAGLIAVEKVDAAMRSFDEQLRQRVSEHFEEEKARTLVRNYEQAQQKLKDEVYPNISGAEPDLSDHGVTHIGNVKENATLLLGERGIVTSLSGIEMYCLGMMILFHDAANVLGRQGHHRRVAEVFDEIRPGSATRHEKSLVVRATHAHTGTAHDGSADTLKEVGEFDHLEGRRVRLRQLAAVLRLADELAEGPQRTSEFMQRKKLISPGAQIFHQYASSTHVFIDRGAGRIVLSYEIEVPSKGAKRARLRKLSKFLEFVYCRILKANQERQYARHYSELVSPFKATEVTFNFHCGSQLLETDLPRLKLTDLVVPGDPKKLIHEINPQYNIACLAEDVLAKCASGRNYDTGK